MCAIYWESVHPQQVRVTKLEREIAKEIHRYISSIDRCARISITALFIFSIT